MSIKSATADDILIGQNIRAVRLRNGWSQQRLGDSLGVTYQQVQKYEKGINRVSVSRLLQIARLLGAHVSRFLEGA